LNIIAQYVEEIESGRKCSSRDLAKLADVSMNTALKAIQFYDNGKIIVKPNGRPKEALGSSYGLTVDHRMILYRLYCDNPSRPLYDYVREFLEVTGIAISTSFMCRWFSSIGPFKGRMRFTSIFPPRKNSIRTLNQLREYLDFAKEFGNHRSWVFADEKPSKLKDTFGKVRRDVFSGQVPHHTSDKANSRTLFNIFAAVNVKKHRRNVESVVLNMYGDSIVFQQFVLHLLNTGFLEAGDVFIVDNCSIHMHGENEFIVENLWTYHGVLMIPLPPYSPELNPTELSFNTLDARIKAKRSRSKIGLQGEDFALTIQEVMDSMSRKDIKGFYRHCGYIV
jgi:transposase